MFESIRAKMTRPGPAAGLLSHPAIAGVVKKATHLRADLLDQLDGRLSGVAKRLNLATRAELKALRRQIRELENQVENLERQLTAERERADTAETELADSAKAQKKAVAAAQKAAEELAALKGSLEQRESALQGREAELAARAAELEGQRNDAPAADKTPSKKAARAKKKAEEPGENEAETPEG